MPALLVVLAGMGASFGAGPAHALIATYGCDATDTSCTLHELALEGASFQLDDKLFSGFGMVVNSLNADLTSLNLTLIDDPGSLNPGPGFAIDYSTLSDPLLGGDDLFVTFSFFVVVLADESKLHDISIASLSESLEVCDPGTAVVCGINDGLRIDEPTAFVQTAVLIDDFAAIAIEFPSAEFMPTSFVQAFIDHEHICGGLIVVADGAECEFSPREIEYRFSQVIDSSQVPEPTTLLLMSLGLAGLGFARRSLH